MNITYLYNLFFSAWLTEICVFFFLSNVRFAFRKWGAKYRCWVKDNFFSKWISYNLWASSTVQQIFLFHCRIVKYTNVYYDWIFKKERWGWSLSIPFVRFFFLMIAVYLGYATPFSFTRQSSESRHKSKEFANAIIGH